MFIYKKIFLTSVFIILLCCFFVVFSFASNMQESFSFSLVNKVSSVLGGSVSQSGNYTVISFSQNSSNNVLIIVDTSELPFVNGESYKCTFTLKCSSNISNHSKCYVGISDKSLSSGSLPDNLTWIYSNDNVSSSLTSVFFNFSYPSNFSKCYLFIELVVNNATSISSGNFSFGSFIFEHIVKSVDIDNGDWSGDDLTLPDVDLSDLITDFSDNQASAIDWITSQYQTFLSSIRSVGYIFSLAWQKLTVFAPQVVFLSVFSLLGGAFCLVVFKRR